MNKVVFVFLIAFSSQIFAKQASLTPDDQTGVQEYLRLGCGYSFDVWDYISEKMHDNYAQVIPSVADESVRYIVRGTDGTWLIAVEWQNRVESSKDEDIACILDRGEKGMEQAALSKPVVKLPSGIISGRVSVPASKPQRTSKSLL